MAKILSASRGKISPTTFNSFIDAANDYKQRQHNMEGRVIPFDTKNGIITVKNSSGSDQARLAILGISSVVVTPALNELEFLSRPTLDCVLPTDAHDGKFVVLLEPIKSGAYGRAMVQGIVPVVLYGDSADAAESAGIVAGQVYLQCGGTGAQILYEDTTSGPDYHLGLVRFPQGGGGVGGATKVKAASTANIASLSGTTTIDGVVLSVDDKILAKNQTTAAQRKVYIVKSGAWVADNPAQPDEVIVTGAGTLSPAGTRFILTAANTYTGGKAFFG